ncbi:hypothetical protein C0J52_19796, partial [Blattella germanica]
AILAQTRTLVRSNDPLEDDDPPRPPRSITFVLPPNNEKGGTGSSGVDRAGLSVRPPLEGVVDYRDWMQVTPVRGEKLYVTKDKRRSQSWRRCICWGIGFVLLSVAILIAVLAGTGVILSQESQTLVTEESVSSRQFGGSSHEHPRTGGSTDRGGGKSEPPPPEISSYTPPPSLPTPVPSMPTTEMSQLYVPRLLEGELVIENMEFNPELYNSSSAEFHKLATSLEEETRQRSSQIPGRLGIQGRNQESTRSHRHGWYTSETRASAQRVLDMCQFGNGECSHECMFDYRKHMNFMCTCPPGLHLDEGAKRCTDAEPSPEPSAEHSDEHSAIPALTSTSTSTSASPVTEDTDHIQHITFSPSHHENHEHVTEVPTTHPPSHNNNHFDNNYHSNYDYEESPVVITTTMPEKPEVSTPRAPDIASDNEEHLATLLPHIIETHTVVVSVTNSSKMTENPHNASEHYAEVTASVHLLSDEEHTTASVELDEHESVATTQIPHSQSNSTDSHSEWAHMPLTPNNMSKMTEETMTTELPPMTTMIPGEIFENGADVTDHTFEVEKRGGAMRPNNTVTRHDSAESLENTAEEPSYITHDVKPETEVPATDFPPLFDDDNVHNSTSASRGIGNITETSTENSNNSVEDRHGGFLFNDLFSNDSDNDTFSNSLSPEDYENHPIAPVENSSSVPLLKKGPRLDDDEMSVMNPHDERFYNTSTEPTVESVPVFVHDSESATSTPAQIHNDSSTSDRNIHPNFISPTEAPEPENTTTEAVEHHTEIISRTQFGVHMTGIENHEDLINKTEDGAAMMVTTMETATDITVLPKEIVNETTTQDTPVKILTPLNNLIAEHDVTTMKAAEMTTLNTSRRNTELPLMQESSVTTEEMEMTTFVDLDSIDFGRSSSETPVIQKGSEESNSSSSGENVIEGGEILHPGLISTTTEHQEDQPNTVVPLPDLHENEAVFPRNYHDLNDTQNGLNVTHNNTVQAEGPEISIKELQGQEDTPTTPSEVHLPPGTTLPPIHNGIHEDNVISSSGEVPEKKDAATTTDSTDKTDKNDVVSNEAVVEKTISPFTHEILNTSSTQENLTNNSNVSDSNSATSEASVMVEKEAEHIDDLDVNLESDHVNTVKPLPPIGHENIPSTSESIIMHSSTEVNLNAAEKPNSAVETSTVHNQVSADNNTESNSLLGDIIHAEKSIEISTLRPTSLTTESSIAVNSNSAFEDPQFSSSERATTPSFNNTDSKPLEHSNGAFEKPNAFTEEDVENKLIVDHGKAQDSGTSSTTEYINDIHALPPSGGGNIIPPTAQSIVLVDPITGDIHHPTSVNELKNETSAMTTTEHFPAENTTQDDSILFPFAKPEKKKDKKPVTSSLQKFDKDSSKKIDKMGLAALPLDESDMDMTTKEVSTTPSTLPSATPMNESHPNVASQDEPRPADELDENENPLVGIHGDIEHVNVVEHVDDSAKVKKSELNKTARLEGESSVDESIAPSSNTTENSTIGRVESNIAVGIEPAGNNETSVSHDTLLIPRILPTNGNPAPEVKNETQSLDASDVVPANVNSNSSSISESAGASDNATSVETRKDLNLVQTINDNVSVPMTTSEPVNTTSESSLMMNVSPGMTTLPQENSNSMTTLPPIPAESSSKTPEVPQTTVVTLNSEDFAKLHKETIEGANSTDVKEEEARILFQPAENRTLIDSSASGEFPKTFSKCASGLFQCVNGTSHEGNYCVDMSAKCDSVNDCSDASDETGCIEDGCPGNFQCASGQCLKRHLVCNGIVDCNDGSDEVNCEKWQCQFDEFQCPSGRCIPALWQCDGKPDCANHTDEFSCSSSCGNDEYLCPEGWCIPMTWRCNGIPECTSGEDEKLCDCSLDQFRCNTGGCIPKSQVCDGMEHCPDMSDEWGCMRLHNDTMKLQIRSAESDWRPVCGDNWDSSWSDVACQNLGYSKAVFTENPPMNDDVHDFYSLKPDATTGSHLSTALQKSANESTCTSGTEVEISCQEFSMDKTLTPDSWVAFGGGSMFETDKPETQIREVRSIIPYPQVKYNQFMDKTLTPDSWVAFGGGSMFETDKPETQIREVRSIIPYPQVKYNQFMYNNDIALVELIQPMTFTRYVGAICLPEKEIEQRQLCVTAGWGYTSPGDYSEAEQLSHKNDEGAPLMCVSEGGVWELQGVLSYHSNCGRGYHPSIFSSITAVRGWVEKTVGSRFERKSTFNVRR